jgi:hypothetical protein
VKLYLALVGLFLAPVPVLVLFGIEAREALAISVFIVVLASFAGLWSLRRLYYATPEPRSLFFRMLLDATSIKALFGTWIGYLVGASILGLPLPFDPITRSIITSIAAVAFMAATVFYAIRSRLIVRSIERGEVPE